MKQTPDTVVEAPVKNTVADAVQPTTPDTEKLAKRREYARAYYSAHKDKMIASVKKCQSKHKTAVAKPRKAAKHAIKAEKHVVKKVAKLSAAEKIANKNLTAAEKSYDKIAFKIETLRAKLVPLMADIKDAKRAVKDAKLAK